MQNIKQCTTKTELTKEINKELSDCGASFIYLKEGTMHLRQLKMIQDIVKIWATGPSRIEKPIMEKIDKIIDNGVKQLKRIELSL